MDSLSADDLYAEAVDVPWSRPLMQGDVFRDVVLPGMGDEPRLVQVVMHPCVMRTGRGVLLERLTVAPVEPSGQRVNDAMWERHLRIMPLPNLLDDGDDYAAKFVEVTAAPSAESSLNRRIAALSDLGILVLQQRLIVHSTRYAEVDLETLRKVSASVLAESELQTDWVEAALDRDGQTAEVVARATSDFQTWLDVGEPSARTRLKSETNHSALRRETRAEIRRRYR